MPESTLDPVELHLLHHCRIREVFNAPELGRLLGKEGLDLSMTDQPEALKIRIEAGLAVLERRVLASISEALRLQARACVLIGILLGILVGIGISIPGQPQATHYAMIGGLVVVGSLLVFLAKKVLGVRSDLKLLARLRGRYHGCGPPAGLAVAHYRRPPTSRTAPRRCDARSNTPPGGSSVRRNDLEISWCPPVISAQHASDRACIPVVSPRPSTGLRTGFPGVRGC